MNKLSQCLVLSLLGVGVFCFGGCFNLQKPKHNKYRETKMLMGTIVHLDTCLQEAVEPEFQNAYKRVWQRLEDISWRMNVYDERSDVSKVNASDLQPVQIAADTYQVIADAKQYSHATGGAFDITVWPLMKLWKNGEVEDKTPEQERIKHVLQAVGTDQIRLLANNSVQLLNRETKIDLGGIAKGYAIDEAARIFREEGIVNFFIDAGGDVYAGGHNCSGASWRVGIRDPRNPSKIYDVVKISDASVTTSGNYEQYFMIQNTEWSHILNPMTGYPQKEVVSATVIAPTATEADALSTALCVLGGERGTKFIDDRTGSYASLILVKRELGQMERIASREYFSYRAQP